MYSPWSRPRVTSVPDDAPLSVVTPDYRHANDPKHRRGRRAEGNGQGRRPQRPAPPERGGQGARAEGSIAAVLEVDAKARCELPSPAPWTRCSVVGSTAGAVSYSGNPLNSFRVNPFVMHLTRATSTIPSEVGVGGGWCRPLATRDRLSDLTRPSAPPPKERSSWRQLRAPVLEPQ
jgi:hypothetical protein